MVKNLPSSLGDTGLIPAQGTKIPHLSLHNTAIELMHSRDCSVIREGLILQLERKPACRTATNSQHSQKMKKIYIYIYTYIHIKEKKMQGGQSRMVEPLG